MPELMPGPVPIPVPGGKTIEEFVGMVATGDDAVSIAHMIAPAGWEEPAQTPDFDEFTIVLDGSMTVDTDDGPMIVLDDLGERKPSKPVSGSFLRNVEEL